MVKSIKIMIVDDNVDTVELLMKRFKSEGYDIEPAYDGEQALRMVRESRPDLIILDIMMPKVDGYEVCRQLKEDENNKHIPILMLTAKSEVSEKVKGFDIGADGYITKPFDYKELAARVRALLAQKEANMERALREKLLALDTMVDEVSHEVRNPLVTIGGFVRRLGRSLPDDDPNKKYIDIILENVASLEKMVNQLVALKSAVVSHPRVEDLNILVNEALSRFDQRIRDNGISVTRRLMEEPPLVPVDHDNLVTAIANIIENCIEAMENSSRKTISITTRVNNNWFEIEITDTGRGISQDTINNIYDPFFTAKTYGPGLGLTFTMKTIRSHGGTIVAQSEVGTGTCFVLRLPIGNGKNCLKSQTVEQEQKVVEE